MREFVSQQRVKYTPFENINKRVGKWWRCTEGERFDGFDARAVRESKNSSNGIFFFYLSRVLRACVKESVGPLLPAQLYSVRVYIRYRELLGTRKWGRVEMVSRRAKHGDVFFFLCVFFLSLSQAPGTYWRRCISRYFCDSGEKSEFRKA